MFSGRKIVEESSGIEHYNPAEDEVVKAVMDRDESIEAMFLKTADNVVNLSLKGPRPTV